MKLPSNKTQWLCRIIHSGVCSAGGFNNLSLSEQVVCSMAAYEDMRTGRPLLKGKIQSRGCKSKLHSVFPGSATSPGDYKRATEDYNSLTTSSYGPSLSIM